MCGWCCPWITQGVTTVFTGVDGYGQGVGTPASLFAQVANGVGPNVATYVGFGAVREKVVGAADRAATAAELAAMRRLTAQGMCQGALGLSTGLFYAPQSFANTAEVELYSRNSPTTQLGRRNR